MRGEKYEIILAYSGNFSKGTNIPLINRRVNLTREVSIITSAGISVGGYEDIKIVIAENVRSARITTGMKIKRFREIPRKIEVSEIKEVIIKPK